MIFLKKLWYSKLLRRRKYSLVLSIFCIVITIYLLNSISSFYEIKENRFSLSLLPNPDTNLVEKVSILLEHKVNHDKLSVRVNFRRDFKDTSSFSIIYPPTIHIVKENSDFSNVTETGSYIIQNCEEINYKVIPSSEFTSFLSLEFEGDILTGDYHESNFSFFVDVLRNSDFPIEFTIIGLSPLQISRIDPNPYETTNYYQLYNFSPPYNQVPELSMNIYDKQSVLKREYYLFVIGVIIGVFVSFITNVLFDIIKEKEKKTI